MGFIELLIFFIVGCGVGFLAGLFGIGGGFIMVPILILSYEQSGISPSVLTHAAIGTSLFVVVFASITSAYQHRKQGNVDGRAVLVAGLSSALSAIITTRWAAGLSGKNLQIAFAVIVLIAAMRMLTERPAKAQAKVNGVPKPGMKGLITVGLITGVVSPLAGIGGGIFFISMMYHFLKVPLKLAIGTSSAAIVITALFSVIGYVLNGLGRPGLPEWSLGFVDLQRGLALAVGTLLFARAGAYVSFKIHPFRLRKLFVLFISVIAVYLLVK